VSATSTDSSSFPSGLRIVPDMPICQQDLPLDWYQEEFKPYAEEYLALPDRLPETVLPWMDGYIKPALEHFGPSLMLIGPWPAVITTVATALAGVVCLAAALNGYLLRHARLWERLGLFAAALTLIKPGLATDLAGLALVAAVAAIQWPREKPSAAS